MFEYIFTNDLQTCTYTHMNINNCVIKRQKLKIEIDKR